MNNQADTKAFGLTAAEPNLVFGCLQIVSSNSCEQSEPVVHLPSQFRSSGIRSSELSKTSHQWSPALSRALKDRYNRNKQRTPRTMTRLMQQHRDNERHRHRGLNAGIKDISRQIPGFETAVKETKIVKLQRIIHYICHLEGHIQSLCQELAVGLEYKNLFLSPHIPCDGNKKRRFIFNPSPCKVKVKRKCLQARSTMKHQVTSSTDQRSCNKSGKKKFASKHAGRRLKVSSPTVDSTTCDASSDFLPANTITMNCMLEQDNLEEAKEPEQAIQALPVLKKLKTGNGLSRSLSPVEMSVLSSSDGEDCFILNTSPTEMLTHVSQDSLLTEAWEGLSDESEQSHQMLESKDNDDNEWMDADYSGHTEVLSHAYDDLLHIFPREMNIDSPKFVQPAVMARFRPIEYSKGEKRAKMKDTSKCSPSSGMNRHPFKSQPNMSFSPICLPFSSLPTFALGKDPALNKKTDLMGGCQIDEGTQPFVVQPATKPNTVGETKTKKSKGKMKTTSTPMNCSPHTSFTNVLSGSQKNQTRKFSSIKKFDTTDKENIVIPEKGPQSKIADKSHVIMDHRKTSWMNGFMMFSRLHRKDYLTSNPGIPASYISRLMGQDWRRLSDQERSKYREYATNYSKKYLQN